MATGDAAYIKKINRSLIISKIIEEKLISRADLSKQTNLTRATISAQAAALLDDELIVETQQDHSTVGRRPIMLSLNRDAGCALGIDLDYDSITFALTDLLGRPVSSRTIDIETTEYEVIVRLLIENIQAYKTECANRRYGLIGIVIGIHGLVTNDEFIHFIPRFQWRDSNLKQDLEKEIDLEIHLENNANLVSFAERVYAYHETENLLCATLYSGIGLGIMMNSEFFRGHNGYAGEAGHMIVMPGGKQCNCGNHGCWEQYASESAFFKELAEKKQQESVSYEDVRGWLEVQDDVVHEMMEQFIYYLSIGLNNMINLYNPEILVLNSELLRLYPKSIERMKDNLASTVSHYRELSISTLGKKACVLGAASLAIKKFLDIPTLDLTFEEKEKTMVLK
ncbi:ROK family protein [Bacillus aerolatus]|uniref:ROK family protein n=1 Tax=Bacillus aerolatus TaxID=2653354 RepID=A0A6I1G0M9_9BACI|nr:ROK family protein [Bacillus aerolatus]KAB7709176.1 ROK family protein [Bacillus aerolatus]